MPSEMRFSEFQKFLESHGWRLVRIRSSHHIFSKADARNIIIPVHGGKVKPFYVRQAKQIIQEEG